VLGETRVTGELDAPEGPLVLAIDATRERYVFSLASENQPARTVGEASTEPLSTELAGGFTGVYFGMYASTSSAAPTPPADFDWFDYHALE
jgi:alpha-N-arabinofuranosidase